MLYIFRMFHAQGFGPRKQTENCMVQLLQDDMYRSRLQHSSFATPLGYCDKQNLYMSIPSGRRYELLPKERL